MSADSTTLSYSSSPFYNKVKEAQSDIPRLRRIYRGITHPQQSVLTKADKAIIKKLKYTVLDGLVVTDSGQWVIPATATKLITDILQAFHDDPSSGHQGIARTTDIVSKYFYWEQLRPDVEKYVKACDVCQRIKPPNVTHGKLQPLSVPTSSWSHISCDFLTDLPLTLNGFDTVMVVVCRLSKMAHFIPMVGNWSAEDVAFLYVRDIFSKHGLPDNITSDRDPKFTSNFWTALNKILGIKLNMSSAHHPQTDGQSERTIRTLEQYLRAYINFQQDDWDMWLPLAEFAHNSHTNNSTMLSPFATVYGSNPKSPLDVKFGTSSVASASEVAKLIRSNVESAQAAMKAAQDRYTKYASKGKVDLALGVGDMVWLRTKYYVNDTTSTRPSRKLGNKYMGPYKITKVVSPVAYKLALPAKFRIHPVIHVSQLKRYVPPSNYSKKYARPAPEIVDGKEVHEIERILDRRTRYNRTEYLVRWKGFSEDDDEWLPDWALTGAPDAIAKFEKLHPL